MLSLLRARRGLAGLEFAIVLPLLLAIFAGVVDVSRAVIMSRRLTLAAVSVATIASTMAVQASSLNLLTGQQAWQATTAPFAIFPEWRPGPSPGSFAITLSSVGFTAGSAGYTANVAWSLANAAGQARLRSCGTLQPAPDATASSLGSLPVDDFGPTSILVADVSSEFVPLFTTVFVGRVTMLRSAYVSPRVNNGVTLSLPVPGPYVTCKGAGP